MFLIVQGGEPKKLENLPKLPQLVSDRAEIQMHMIWSLSLRL